VTPSTPPATAVQTGSPTVGILPGLILSSLVAVAAAMAGPSLPYAVPIPIIALLIGIALQPIARRPWFGAGIAFCLKKILPVAVALLGLRIAFADIAALGIGTAALVVLSMAATILAGFVFAGLFRLAPAYGALCGAGTAVCGASATLATSIVLPDYKGKDADIAFVVMAVNVLSTAAMVLYPILSVWLGFDQQQTGIMLGATIHDVAQVVGAGFAVSEPTGNTAVIVKLFRVFLLLPVVCLVGWWFARASVATAVTRIPVPVFALGFLGLCALNSVAPALAEIAPIYAALKPPLVEISTWGLLVAISALGLGTSIADISERGWRHIATVTGTTIVILGSVTAGLMLLA
jgi:uncharacterized integral membrane protein (TIGR00698 family)